MSNTVQEDSDSSVGEIIDSLTEQGLFDSVWYDYASGGVFEAELSDDRQAVRFTPCHPRQNTPSSYSRDLTDELLKFVTDELQQVPEEAVEHPAAWRQEYLYHMVDHAEHRPKDWAALSYTAEATTLQNADSLTTTFSNLIDLERAQVAGASANELNEAWNKLLEDAYRRLDALDTAPANVGLQENQDVPGINIVTDSNSRTDEDI